MKSPIRRLQSSSLRLRFERLESRVCPSCTVFQTGQTLTILGDRLDNHITIEGSRAGGITVTCDGSVAQLFNGVQQIDLRSQDGNDTIDARFADTPDPHFMMRVDLGAGNDQFMMSHAAGAPDARPATAVNDHFDLKVLGGQGNDHMALKITPTSDTLHTLATNMDIGLDGDAGDDGFMMNVDDIVLAGHFMMNTNGGSGNDEWMMNLGNLKIDGVLSLSTICGFGNDSFMTNVGDLKIRGGFMMNTSGGPGDDFLSVQLFTSPGVISGFDPQPDPPSSLAISLSGDAGNDRLSVAGGDPHHAIAAEIAASSRLRLDGGAGNDQFMMDLGDLKIRGDFMMFAGGSAGNDAFMMHLSDIASDHDFMMRTDGGLGDDSFMMNLADLRIDGDFMMNNSGGSGNDLMAINWSLPSDTRPGQIHFRADLDAGNDTFTMRLESALASFTAPQGPIDLEVLGGLGNDDLMLTILGLDDPTILSALADGGRGVDMARITHNVRVVNVEKTIFVDGAR